MDDDDDGTTKTQTHSHFANRAVVLRAVVTQKAEDPTFNRCDAGSTPAGGTQELQQIALVAKRSSRRPLKP